MVEGPNAWHCKRSVTRSSIPGAAIDKVRRCSPWRSSFFQWTHDCVEICAWFHLGPYASRLDSSPKFSSYPLSFPAGSIGLFSHNHRRRLGGSPGAPPPNIWETPMHLSVFTTFRPPTNILCSLLQSITMAFYRAPRLILDQYNGVS